MTVSRQKLHPKGPELSRLVWGTSRALKSPDTDTPAKMARLIEGCVDLGITAFDCAAIYGGYRTEAVLGKALHEWGGPRGSVQLVTKCGIALVDPARPEHKVKHYDAGPAHIQDSVEASLNNLGTDYIDVLLLHRFDYLMDADATAEVLEGLVRAGKVRYVGVSNHTPSQTALLQDRLSIPLVTNQIEFSVHETTPLFDGTLEAAQRARMSPMIWAPMAGGTLFRKTTLQAHRVALVLAEVAAEHGREDPSQAALAWVLRHPSRPVPVLGTSRLARLKSLAAADGMDLDPQQWFRILEASRGAPVA